MADDRELWERICRGDAAAFDAFYKESAPRLQRFLKQIVGNSQAAEDVTHETFLQIWRRPNGFRPEAGSLRGYLFGIARKRASEWWRQRHPEIDSALPERSADAAESVEQEASSSSVEVRSMVGDALSRLDTEQRALLWLREVEGQSYAELAEILEVPVGTVRSRLFAAREELRRIWHSRREVGEKSNRDQKEGVRR